jgi:hypothetical protein
MWLMLRPDRFGDLDRTEPATLLTIEGDSHAIGFTALRSASYGGILHYRGNYGML